MLSYMESTSSSVPDPAADLAAAHAAQGRLTRSLRLPSVFHVSIGMAVAVQIAGVAYSVEAQSARGVVALVVGCAIFLGVAGLQLARFRSLNGVRVDGLFSRAVMGTTTSSSLVYGAGLAGAILAATGGYWWAVAAACIAAGLGYAASAGAWWSAYVGDPETHARAESRVTLVVVGAVALAGLLVLVALT